jgi:hypothetical protein
MSGRRWNILTGEYPPQLGGVADYTWQVAHGLASRGDQVDVWASRCTAATHHTDDSVTVHRLVDHFGWRGLVQLSAAVERAPGALLLVQYVPHAFGWNAMNLPFLLWLTAQRHAPMDVIFHEVSYPVRKGQLLRHNALGYVTRLMAWMVSRSAQRIYLTVPGWESLLPGRVSKRTPIRWMPMPSNIPRIEDREASGALRRRYLGRSRFLIGHFGTYGSLSTALLRPLAVDLLRRRSDIALLLVGDGSAEFVDDMVVREPPIRERVHATGRLCAADLSRHLSACDLMVQRYSDGISSRRTSVMAPLSHGIPVVSSVGIHSEPIWAQTGAVALAPTDDVEALANQVERLLEDYTERCRLSRAGLALYDRRFDLRHSIDALQEGASQDSAAL